MLKVFLNIFRIPDLRKRVLFTLGLLVILQLGRVISIPGINPRVLESYMGRIGGQGSLVGILNMFTGGAFEQLSVFALGVMPYITASIILQLLMVVWPYLEELGKKGDEGRRKINQYTRYGTVLITLLQGGTLVFQIAGAEGGNIRTLPFLQFVLLGILSLITGTILLMWLGEQITEHGIGNGISLIIFANIVARFPNAVAEAAQRLRLDDPTFRPLTAIGVVIGMVVVTMVIVILEASQRRITIKRGRQVVGRKVYGGNVSYLPIRINQAGVIPVIFASSILAIPQTIGQFTGWAPLRAIGNALSYGSWVYIVVEFIMIIFFCFFYTAITFNPHDVAENLQKYGIAIPGYSSGRRTEEYIERILVRVTVVGALILAAIAILPTIFFQVWKIPASITQFLGGTSLIIVVGVALDTVNQIENHLQVRNYQTFRKRPRGRF